MDASFFRSRVVTLQSSRSAANCLRKDSSVRRGNPVFFSLRIVSSQSRPAPSAIAVSSVSLCRSSPPYRAFYGKRRRRRPFSPSYRSPSNRRRRRRLPLRSRGTLPTDAAQNTAHALGLLSKTPFDSDSSYLDSWRSLDSKTASGNFD